MSFLTGASDFMEIARSGSWDQLKNFSSRTVTGIFEPNLIKQIGRYFDPTVYAPENIKERVMVDMRIAGWTGVKPKLNVFGQEVDADRFPSLEPKSESKDPVVSFLAQNNLWITVPAKNTQIKVGKENREMTVDEYYRYVGESGPAIKAVIEKKMELISRQRTADDKQKLVNELVQDERERVKKQIQRDANK